MEEIQKKSIRHEIPKDAVIMTRREALIYQWEILRKWKPRSDVWPLTFGRVVLSGVSAFSGIYINYRFRRKLRLLNYAWFPTAIGLSMAPAMVSSLAHTDRILNKLLLLEVSCPLCLQSQSASIQMISGVFFPLLLAPLANFGVIAGTGLYNVPFAYDVKSLMKVLRSIYQPLIPQIALLFTFHALIAGFITHLEMKAFLRIQNMQYLLDSEEQSHEINI